jgi:hypothetical protein
MQPKQVLNNFACWGAGSGEGFQLSGTNLLLIHAHMVRFAGYAGAGGGEHGTPGLAGRRRHHFGWSHCQQISPGTYPGGVGHQNVQGMKPGE